MPKFEPVAVRFWRYVQKSCGCWLWVGHRHEKGYGLLSVDRRPRRAHRISWEMHCGPIPDGMQVLHRCDTPACVNPDHLFLGSNEDNHADKLAKGRQGAARGENGGSAKLTEAQVRQILASSDSPTAVAARYGISPSYVTVLRRRQKWAHLTN